MNFEASTALIGALVLVLVLVVCYMVLMLEPGKSDGKRGCRPCGEGAKDGFCASARAMRPPWLAQTCNARCGFPTGPMPSISENPWGADAGPGGMADRFLRPPFARGTFATPCGPLSGASYTHLDA